MRIAFAHTKGGVGKTTASIMLAAAVEKRGIPVVVYDADPQASASRWAEVAIARDDPLGFEVKRVNAQFYVIFLPILRGGILLTLLQVVPLKFKLLSILRIWS